MSYRISLSEEVGAEILSLSAYYEGIRGGLGAEFEAEVGLILATISRSPLLYPIEVGQIRRGLVKRFKLNIFYLLVGDRLGVIHVRDARREPPDWKAMGYQSN